MQEGCKAMPSLRSAGKSHSGPLPICTPPANLQSSPGFSPQNPALLLQNEGPAPTGKVTRHQATSGSSRQPPGQPGGGDAHTDLGRPQAAEGQDELPDARATAPTATRAWAGKIHISLWAVFQDLRQEADWDQLWALHRPGPTAPSVRQSSRLPHPKSRCLIPPVTPFRPPYFRAGAWQPLNSICPSPSALTHACMLRHFGCVQLFVTLWTIAFQAPLPGKNTGVSCRALLQGISPAAPALYTDSLPLSYWGSLSALIHISRHKPDENMGGQSSKWPSCCLRGKSRDTGTQSQLHGSWGQRLAKSVSL